MSYPKPKKRKVTTPKKKHVSKPTPPAVLKAIEKKGGLTDSGNNPYNGGSIFDANPTKYSKPMAPAGSKKKK